MNLSRPTCLIALACLLLGSISRGSIAQDDKSKPKPVPSTRAEMLAALEKLKSRTPRLPLPAAEPESETRAAGTTGQPSAAPSSGASGLGQGVVNNARMRNYYLPSELRSSASSRQADPAMKFDNVFSVELFWIVSRVNNCHYCLGHQEVKLKSAGVSERQLHELDTDWKKFPADQQAAFVFARKLTYAPQAITSEDIDALRQHFEPERILEIAFLVGRYNSTNRWTDSLGIPQEDHREFKSELPEDSLKGRSEVAIEGFPARAVSTDFKAWKADYERAASRQSRIPLAKASQSSLNYERLLSTFPVSGQQWIEQVRRAHEAGTLATELKDKIGYVAARADQAWYMQHRARTALLKQGMNDADIFALSTAAAAAADESASKAATKDATTLALGFAYKLTASPQAMTDSDIEGLLEHFTPSQVAEIVYHVGIAAFMDRVTETAGLGWIDEAADAS